MDLQSTGFSMNLSSSVGSGDPAITDRITVSDSTNNSATPGTGVGAADGMYRNANISVVSGTPFTLDLTSATQLKDIFGLAITAAHILAWKMTNKAAPNAGNGTLTIGGGTNGLFSYAIPVEPGGQAGQDNIKNGGLSMTVDGTHKIIQIAASAGTIAGTLSLLMRSL